MKKTILNIFSLGYLLAVNTQYFWEKWAGGMLIPIIIVMMIVFILLFIILAWQIAWAYKENFRDKPRLISIGLLIISLLLVALKPGGTINFEQMGAKDLFIAERKGVANCHTMLKLKADKSFLYQQVCFGVEKRSGIYHVKNDTIFLRDKGFGEHTKAHCFAVVRPSVLSSDTAARDLLLFDQTDTTGYALRITRDEIFRKSAKKVVP